MNETFTIPGARRELAHRVNAGIAITLYWNVDDDTTSIEIFDDATEETLTFTVARTRALDAFYHPFAHASTTGSALVAAARNG